MAYDVGTIVDDARDRAFPYGQGGQDVPDLVLVRMLAGLDYELQLKASEAAPQLISSAGTQITLDGSQESGYSLNAGVEVLGYRDFVLKSGSGAQAVITPIIITTEEEFDRPQQGPSAIIRGTTFYPIDPTGNRWVGASASFFLSGETVDFRVVGLPTKPTTRSSALGMPEFTREYYITSLVGHLYAINEAPDSLIQRNIKREDRLFNQVSLHISKSTNAKHAQPSSGLTGNE